MKRSVLDHNLERLLQRAYAPVRAAPEFQARLLRGLASAPPAAPRRVSAAKALVRIAAVLLVLLGVAWIVARGLGGAATAPGRDELVAQGRCALRAGTGDWRALSAVEEARGVECAPGATTALELATPARAGTRVWFGAEGSAALAGGTRAALAFDAGRHALALALEDGALVLERLAAGGAWTVDTAQGRFELERGVLELAYAGPELQGGARAVRARLVAGAGAFHGPEPVLALAVGAEYVARGGALLDVASATTGALDDRDTRTLAADPGPVDGAPPGVAADALRAGLRAEILAPAGRAITRSGVATLLREERLPAIGRPIARAVEPDAPACRWDAVEPGAYELFVQVPGFGAWRANDLVLAAGETLSIVVRLGQGASVRGRVVDADTGAPIPDAEIVSETDAPSAVLPFDLGGDEDSADFAGWSCVARSGPDGAFELAGLSAGKHVLRAWAPGHGAEWSAPMLLEAGAEAPELRFRLARGGAVEGRLADDAQRPRAGARVLVSRIDFGAPRRVISYALRRTDAEGRFAFAHLASGLYALLTFQDAEPGPSMQQVVVRAGETVRIDLPGGERGATLRGRLLRADGTPARSVDVSIQHAGSRGRSDYRNERTDDEGRFVFRGLPALPHELYAGKELGARLTALGALDVPDVNEFAREFTLGAHALEGVVHGAGGARIESAAVVLEVERDGRFEFGSRSVTDAQGRWSAEFLAPGRWRARVYAAGDGMAPARIAPFQVPAAAPIETVLLRGASLTVRAADPRGAALPGARVEFVDALGEPWSATLEDATDAHGLLRVPGIAAGAWTVRVFREGSAPAAARITLDAGDDRELPFTLDDAGPK
ncbi:MAG: carboxypeptidase regulatory-like domain-containing protein [Planctomycetes bacterium]|nr:carboxypeptidase regulatory-like domain-containing protein [Planctomycetota bacterium]